MRVVFFGTPPFAVPSLEALLDAGFDVPLVVTRPDRAVGRSSRLRPSAVGEVAAAQGLAMEKPEKLRGNSAFLRSLAAVEPDAIAVVAYGRLLPSEVLDLPRLGCVNVHASLLPRHRGASPVAGAILAGDRETGVVTMKVVPELDAGPVYLERRIPIGDQEDAASLSERLAREGGDLLVETLRGLDAGSLVARAQEGEATYTRPLTRADGGVDWTLPADEIERRLRAFRPWPGLHGEIGGERVKILDLERADGIVSAREPGSVWQERGRTLVAAGGGSALVLKKVQRAGRRPVDGTEFLRGIPTRPTRFSPVP
jgi:methionyl-tRNA formyltransferase